MSRTWSRGSILLFSSFLSFTALAGCGTEDGGTGVGTTPAPPTVPTVPPAVPPTVPGGPVDVPQPTVDGPAWFITPSMIGQGILAVGGTSSSTIIVYNISKKTPLRITSISVQGQNPGDFTLDSASVNSALNTELPPRQSAYSTIKVTFSPTAEGPRSASIEIVSNAGTTSVPLSVRGAPNRPVADVTKGPIDLSPMSSLYTVTLNNTGGEPLVVQSVAITGPDASTFYIIPPSAKSRDCSAGRNLPTGTLSQCYIPLSYVSGSVGQKRADLVVQTNDPVNPSIDIPISFSSP